MDTAPLFDRLRGAFEEIGLRQAVLSSAETLASLGCFELPAEDWPVGNPFVGSPAVLCLGPDDAVLVVADFHAGDVRPSEARVVTYRSYDFERAPDPAGELKRALTEAGLAPGRTGIEAESLPALVADWLREAGCEPVACDRVVEASRLIKLPVELNAIRYASRLADVVQQAVKDHAAPGVSEAELAGLAAAASSARPVAAYPPSSRSAPGRTRPRRAAGSPPTGSCRRETSS
ncbi:MAG TPA: hypothetical protein VGF23_09775 [Gaiellaceae bacterium]